MRPRYIITDQPKYKLFNGIVGTMPDNIEDYPSVPPTVRQVWTAAFIDEAAGIKVDKDGNLIFYDSNVTEVSLTDILHSDSMWKISGNDMYSVNIGNVGIGLPPTGNFKLDVNGSLRTIGKLTLDVSGSDTVDIAANSLLGYDFRVYNVTKDLTRFLINTQGRASINTVSSAAQLNVVATSPIYIASLVNTTQTGSGLKVIGGSVSTDALLVQDYALTNILSARTGSVTIFGNEIITGYVSSDSIVEYTQDHGVFIDSITIKDNSITATDDLTLVAANGKSINLVGNGVTITSLPIKIIETNVVYYDTETGSLSYGPAGSYMVYPEAGIAVSTGTAWAPSITDNSSNWNTAYGWGNHAAFGYLTVETDPIFAGSAAYTITYDDITKWLTAYNWGNHALAGYLTSQNWGRSNGIVYPTVATDSVEILPGTNLYFGGTDLFLSRSVDSLTVTKGLVTIAQLAVDQSTINQLVISNGQIADTAIRFSDILTGNASTANHGYLPKLIGTDYQHLNGHGEWERVDSGRTGGMLAEPTFTNSGAGVVVIGASQLNAYHTSNYVGPIYTDNLAGSSFTLTDGVMNYIIASYENGGAIYKSLTDLSTLSWDMATPVYSIFRSGETLRELSWDSSGVGLPEKLLTRLVLTERFKIEGGLVLSESAGRVIVIGAGNAWHGVRRQVYPQITSTGGCVFYYHAGGVWTRNPAVTTYNNSQYDNGTNLVALTGNKYTVNWIYRGMDENGTMAYVLGNTAYNSVADATKATPRTDLPPVFAGVLLLVGRIIVGNGLTVADRIDSAFVEVFAIAPTSDHGSLTGLLDDDHTQYALLAGRAGGQVLNGGTASGETLTLVSTSNATKGKILFGTSAYDEVNNRLGIGTNAPQAPLQVGASVTAGARIMFGGSNVQLGVLGDGQLHMNNYIQTNSFATAGFTVSTNNFTTSTVAVLARFRAGTTDRFLITQAGNVGIGSAVPASYLHVAYAPVAIANYGTVSLGSAAFDGTTTGYFVGGSSGTTLAMNEASGYVGNFIDCQLAGTMKFRVSYTGSVYVTSGTWIGYTNNSRGITIGDPTTMQGFGGVGLKLWDTTAGIYDSQLYITGNIASPYVNIKNRLLIGDNSTAPSANLQVVQRPTGVGTVTVSGTAVTGTGTQFTNTFKAGDTITVTTTSGSETKAIVTVTSDTVLVTAAFSGTATNVTYTLAGGTILVVRGNGNVGIGISSPQRTLDVAGNIGLTGQVMSSLAIGTSPFSVVSTTVNTNLNADLLDGYHSTSFELALGNPVADGYVLSSTAAGVRSWVAMTGGTNYWQRNLTIVSPATIGDTVYADYANLGNTLSNTKMYIGRKGGTFDSILRNTGSTWVDYTTAGQTTLYDSAVQPLLGTAYKFYVGKSSTFTKVYFSITIPGVNNTLTFEYSKGSGVWGTLTVTDGTANLTVNGTISFTVPGDWATDTVNGAGPYYWIRLATSTVPSTFANLYAIFTDDEDLFRVRSSSYDTYDSLVVDKRGFVAINAPIVNPVLITNTLSVGGNITAQNSYLYSYLTGTTTGYNIGVYSAGATVATSGVPVQNSPTLRLLGRAWNSTSSATKDNSMEILVVPTTGATTYPTMVWHNSTVDGSTTPSITIPMTLKYDGTLSIVGQLISSLATGTSPLAVTSTTVNTNLNSDLLDGKHASDLELALGNPGSDGYILSSTVAGVRSWISPGGYWKRVVSAISPVTSGDSLEVDTIHPQTGTILYLSASTYVYANHAAILASTDTVQISTDSYLYGLTIKASGAALGGPAPLTTLCGGTGSSTYPNGGDVCIYGGTNVTGGTKGSVYLGTKSTGALDADTSATNVVTYNSSTGKLNYATKDEGPKFKITTEGGYAVKMTAGENLYAGEVVGVGSADSTVVKAPINSNMPIGIVYADATSGNSVWVVVAGLAYVLPNASNTAVRGDVMTVSSTTAGRVDQSATVPAATTHFRECGHFVAAGTGAGVKTLAIIHFN